MIDLVTRLRDWRTVHLARLHLLMDEAADEMERLSGSGYCPEPDNAANEDNDRRLAALQALTAVDEELSLPRRTLAALATPSQGSVHNGCTLAAEVRRLRAAITALADQAATLSVCNGNVTVTMDATLTDDERAAVHWFAHYGLPEHHAATLRGLLERL